MPQDEDVFRKQLATIILNKRQQMSLSQEEIARRSKLHRTYISDVERGERNISVESLRRIATALDMQVWQLVQYAEEAQVEHLATAEPVGAQ
jgi:transcriptional regulator with XRE-family HTH domain